MTENIYLQQHGTQAYFRLLIERKRGVYDLAREMTDQFEKGTQRQKLRRRFITNGTDLLREA